MKEDEESGECDLMRTSRILQKTMTSVYSFLNFTMETALDFQDRRLPTLDFKLWISQENIVLYTFFEKSMTSNQVMHRSSALPENTKMASLNAEVIRRMQNTSEILPDVERVVVIDNFSQKLATLVIPWTRSGGL